MQHSFQSLDERNIESGSIPCDCYSSHKYLQVATGPDSTCTIKDKNIACWGGLMYISPTSIPGGNSNFTQIVSGGGASVGGSYMLERLDFGRRI